MKLLRRNRDFRLLLTGSSISMLGTRVSAIAYPLLVLAITGSPVIAGWTCFATAAPSALFYLPAGALVDRWNPRSAMLVCESARGIAIAGVAVVLIFWEPVAWLIVVAVVEQILAVFSTLAERRIALSLVDLPDAPSALAQTEARTHMVILAGRPLGALLFGAARMLPFFVDAVTFGLCVGFLKHISYRQGSNSQERASKLGLREIREGFGWLHVNPFAGVALCLTAGTTLIGQALIMVFLGRAHAIQLSASMIGVALAASGVGGALGSAVAPQLFGRFGYSLFGFQLSAWTATFAGLAVLGGQPIPAMAIAMAILGLTGALGNVALDMYIFENAPRAILARVMSVGQLISFWALALGPLLGGSLLKQYGAQGAVIVLFIAAGALKLAALAMLRVRTSDNPSAPYPAGEPLAAPTASGPPGQP